MTQLRIVISRDGDVQIGAFCLATDSWQDYETFLSEAAKAFEDHDVRRGNRYLRAGLSALFAHFEGVTRRICGGAGAPTGVMKGRPCDRTYFLLQESRKRGSLPGVDFAIGKHLRDLVAHPGITKGGGKDELLDEVTVFDELTLASLEDMGRRVGQWLDAACFLFAVQRFTDTKATVESIHLSDESPDVREL